MKTVCDKFMYSFIWLNGLQFLFDMKDMEGVSSVDALATHLDTKL